MFWFIKKILSSQNVSNSDTPDEPKHRTRKFIPTQHSSSSNGKSSVVSYNILAQAYVRIPDSCNTPTYYEWKYRSQAILSDLRNLGADFLCLQEVDEYHTFYKRNLANMGYSSIYAQRKGGKPDGCAIFYKPKKAEMLLEKKIDFNDLEGEDSSSADSPYPFRWSFKRDCVAIMAAFKLKDQPTCVIVANTHIYWNPKMTDLKLAQAEYLITSLIEFRKKVRRKFNCQPAVIVCGDFNSQPGDQVYRYLLSNQDGLHLKSAYGSTRGEPKFTNFKSNFQATLDYIFFSSSPNQIKPISCLELPNANSDDVVGGLPNKYHPSDHLPIGATFGLL